METISKIVEEVIIKAAVHCCLVIRVCSCVRELPHYSVLCCRNNFTIKLLYYNFIIILCSVSFSQAG